MFRWMNSLAGSPPGTGLAQEGTAIDRRSPQTCRLSGDQRNDRIFARIISGVSATGGNPAAKQQSPARVVKQNVPGSLRPERARQHTIRVVPYRNSRNGSCTLLQIRLRPIAG